MENKTYKPDFDVVKFKELMLYAAFKSSSDDTFGATKLNKILFFSDFLSFGLAGHPITGATYQKLENGPAPIELKPVAREIEQTKDGIFVKRPWFNYTQIRLVAMRPPNNNVFTPEEKDLIDDVIRNLSGYDATGASELSHIRSIAWQIADIGEKIPYEAVFLSSRKATDADIQRGQELARKHGWLGIAK